MKYGIFAHADDEILFGNPNDYDKIVIVFTDRSDIPGFGQQRLKALEEHPLKDKIEVIGLIESNYWRDETKYEAYIGNYFDLKDWLELNINDDDEVTTHNAQGEYGHADHKLVYTCVMDTVDCKVNGQDAKLYREIKNVYKKHGVWTFFITPTNKEIVL